MPTLTLPQLQVHYLIHGVGRPMVLLHGMTSDHRSLLGTFEPLLAERPGWRRLYLDLPGMGQTPGAEWITGSDQMLDVVCQAIDRIIPEQRFVLVGESYGGYLARGVVHRKAEWVNGLMLMCPSVKPNDPSRRIPERRIIATDPTLAASLSAEMRAALDEVATVHTPAVVERLLADYMPAYRSCDRAFLTRLRERYAFSFEVNDPTCRHDFPTLLIAGRQDSLVGYADQLDLHPLFPRGTIAVLDRAGHVTELEQPALFRALAHDWLDRVEEALQQHGYSQDAGPVSP